LSWPGGGTHTERDEIRTQNEAAHRLIVQREFEVSPCQQSMFLIRRFLIHVMPHGFHRTRHYGLFVNSNRAANIARPILGGLHHQYCRV
jgi:Putative transposase